MENKFRLVSKSDKSQLSEWVSNDGMIKMWLRLKDKNSVLIQSDILDSDDNYYIVEKTGKGYGLKKIDR